MTKLAKEARRSSCRPADEVTFNRPPYRIRGDWGLRFVSDCRRFAVVAIDQIAGIPMATLGLDVEWRAEVPHGDMWQQMGERVSTRSEAEEICRSHATARRR